MSLDLSIEQHRWALFNACTLTPKEREQYLRGMGDDNGPCVQFCRALSSPEQSAAIVRALLEACKVRVVEHGKSNGVMVDFLYVSVVDHEDDPESPLYVSMALEQVPQKVLRLLDCADRGNAVEDRHGALTALKKHEQMTPGSCQDVLEFGPTRPPPPPPPSGAVADPECECPAALPSRDRCGDGWIRCNAGLRADARRRSS